MWFYNAHIKMAVDIAGHACAQVGKPRKRKEGGVAQTNASVFLMQGLISGKSYIR